MSMPFKTTLEAALAHLKSKGIIKRDNDIMAPLGIKSKGTVSSYASGANKMSNNFKEKFENQYKLKLADFENLVPKEGNENEKPPPNDEGLKDKYIALLEAQLDLLNAQAKELKPMAQELAGIKKHLAALQTNIEVNQSYAKTIYKAFQQHRALTEGSDLEQIQNDMDKELVASEMEFLKKGN
jgi:hypothetical protein